MVKVELPPGVADAARRMMDAVNLHVQVRMITAGQGAEPPYIPIRLVDGRPAAGETLYDNRRDAARHHANDVLPCFFVKINPEPMTFREAVLVLQQNRQAYAGGIRFVETEVVTPQLSELNRDILPRTLKALDDRA